MIFLYEVVIKADGTDTLSALVIVSIQLFLNWYYSFVVLNVQRKGNFMSEYLILGNIA